MPETTLPLNRGGALEGVVVIEFGNTLAAEYTGGLLADMGATVVKVEPPEGSPMRGRGRALPDEDSLYFQSENRGKYSVVGDIGTLANEVWFRELVATADGMVEDLGPGALEQHGLGPDDLGRLNPRLSVLRLSPFGQTGPLADAGGDDRIAQAFSSAQFVTGFLDRPPQPITVPMADCWTGVLGASGLVAAILRARRTGAGEVADLALYEAMLRTQGGSITSYAHDGSVTQRQGNFAQGVVPGNVFDTSDGGFVALSGAGEKPFARLCEAIDRLDALDDPRFATIAGRRLHREESNALVADWIGVHTLADVEARFMEYGVAGAAVRSADEIVDDPHVEARGSLVPLTSTSGTAFKAPGATPQLRRTPATPPLSAPRLGEHTTAIGTMTSVLRGRQAPSLVRGSGGSTGGVLDGFRVVDLTQALAGPFAAGLLGDFGAEVVMVELPTGATGTRFASGERMGFLATNRNKASVTLDVRVPEGRKALLDLVRMSDVLMENFRPGTLERWGIGPDVLHSINPGLVIMRISGFGQTGPYSGRTSYNPVACAFGGVTYVGGWPDRAPLRDGVTAGDYVSGLFGVFGIVSALARRDLDGEGQVVDTAMYESAMRMTGDTIALKTALGIRQERDGGAWPVYPISVTAEATDAQCVAISAQSWDELASALHGLGIEAPATSAAVREALRAYIERHTAGDAVAALRSAGALCSEVNSAAHLAHHPHAIARGNIVEIDDAQTGQVTVPGVAPAFSRSPGRVRGWSPAAGSDNTAILGGLLGYDEQRLAEVTRPAASSEEAAT